MFYFAVRSPDNSFFLNATSRVKGVLIYCQVKALNVLFLPFLLQVPFPSPGESTKATFIFAKVHSSYADIY